MPVPPKSQEERLAQQLRELGRISDRELAENAPAMLPLPSESPGEIRGPSTEEMEPLLGEALGGGGPAGDQETQRTRQQTRDFQDSQKDLLEALLAEVMEFRQEFSQLLQD